MQSTVWGMHCLLDIHHAQNAPKNFANEQKGSTRCTYINATAFFSIRTNQCGRVDVFNQWHPAPHYAYLQFSPAARRYEIAMQML